MTVRDEVWDAVLPILREEGKFKMSDLAFEDSKKHTVRRVLKEMEAENWLSRKGENAKIWRAGEKAKENLQIDDETWYRAQIDEK